jgi:hypothetical protein
MKVTGQLNAPPAFPRGRAPGTDWIRDLMGPRTGLEDMEIRKILPLPGLELWPVAIPAPLALLYTHILKWSFALREKQIGGVWEQSATKNILTRETDRRPKSTMKKYITVSVRIFILHQMSLGSLNQGEWAETCSTHGDEWCIQILVGQYEGKLPVGRPRRGCEDNIKTDVREIEYEVWTGLN